MARADERTRRIFIAVDLETEVRHGLLAHLDASLSGKQLPGSAPPPENWHITLRFLGKLDERTYDTVLGRLDEADLGGPFEIAFAGLGAFPRPARATVLWLGIGRGGEELGDLAGAVEGAVVTAGFMPEERPFHPHITLSRIRPHQDVRPLIANVPEFGARQTVAAVTVFESHLGRGPAVYEPLERFDLI